MHGSSGSLASLTLPSLTSQSVLGTDATGKLVAGSVTGYTLPTASLNVLGGVKVGGTLSISNGTLSAKTYVGAQPAVLGESNGSAGVIGYVPAATAAQYNYFLRGDGTWVIPTNTVTRLRPNISSNYASGDFMITGSGATTVGYSNGVFTINSTDTDTTYIAFRGANASTAGTLGLVPAPAKGTQASYYLRADGSWQIPPDNNTTYSAATTTANGLMSSTDKSKLDGIASGANAYVLPVASSDGLGGIKVGSGLSIDENGILTAGAATRIGTDGINYYSGNVQITGEGATTVTYDSRNNTFTITSTDTNTDTTYSAGTGLTLSGTTFSVTDGVYAPATVMQDSAPTGTAGKLWWETDTGILKIYSGSVWVDAVPMPDMNLYLTKAGGSITGDMSIGQALTVTGNISTQAAVSASGGNSGQWNAAYRWGNHADAGYAASSHNHDSVYLKIADTGSIIDYIVASAPGTLDTLNEIAAAIGDDANFSASIASVIAGKANASHTHDDRYYTETEVDTLLAGKAAATHTHSYDNYGSWTITDGTNSNAVGSTNTITFTGAGASSIAFNRSNNTLTVTSTDTNTWRPLGTGATDAAAGNHTHDDRYYTETEVNTLLAGKLGSTAKAADANLLDGNDSSYFYPASTGNGYLAGDINGNTTHQRLWGTDSVQNLIQFNPPTEVEYSTDGGTTWVTDTISGNVFSGKIYGAWSGWNVRAGTAAGGWTHARLTWRNFGYRFFSHFTIGHSTNGHSFNFVFYKSDLDGRFGAEAFRQNGISSWPGYTFVKHTNVSGWWDTRDIRIVFEVNRGTDDYTNNSITIGHIGIMGSYGSFTRLYDWDGDRNLSFANDISVGRNITVGGTVDGRDIATDGTKLDGIASNANNYSLPVATASVLGGVKTGTNISIAADGTISSTDTNTVTSVGVTGDLSTGNITLAGSGATTITKSGGTITISSTDNNTTYSVFTGANASEDGTTGLVVAPRTTNRAQFLRGDGAWATPTDTNTTYTAGTGLSLSGTEFSVTANTYAAATHGHAISDVTGLQTALDGKLSTSGTAAAATVVTTIQDTAPTGTAGKLWWESDTGILKVYYGSAWVDAVPMPDTTLFYPKAGGSITGDVAINQTLTVTGNTSIGGTITTTSHGNSSQWDTAYRWGNHADAGYIKTYTDTNTVTSVGVTGDLSTGNVIIAGSGATTVTKSGGTITISSTDTDTTYSDATTERAGLMSSTDKSKLDGIATGANNYTYTLPVAGTAIGGVKSGTDITVDASGNVSVNDDSHTHDGRYYTESEVDTLLAGKQAAGTYLTSLPSHNHDDRYFTETESDSRYLKLAGGTMTGTLTAPTIVPTLFHYAYGWRKYFKVRSVGVSGGSINNKWVHLFSVEIGGSYDKALIKAKINGYDDVSIGTEVIQALYENGGSTQENHDMYWYSIDNTASLFKTVKSIRTSTSGLRNTYEVWVQMAGDWRDTFTMEVEFWEEENRDLTFGTANGQDAEPSGDANDITKTSRQWAVNSNLYIGGNITLAGTVDGRDIAADGTKLDGIASGANNYSLPVAGTSIGGVKSGTDITVDASGNVSVNDDSHTHDGRYYTESEIDTKLAAKAASSHTHAASDITSGTLDLARIPEWLEEKYIYSSNDANGVYMPMVKGGMYATQTPSITGAIKVTLPAYQSNMMFTIYVDIYEYTTGETVTLRVSGYAYGDAGATWHNCSVVNLADNSDRDYTVRFYSDTANSRQYFTIGETTSAWSYPQVMLRDFWGGYQTSEAEAQGTWRVEFVTSFDGDLRHTFSGNLVAADWDNIRDKPTTFSPSAHTHDDRYYTESEVDTLLAGKAASSHTHNYVATQGNYVWRNDTLAGSYTTGIQTSFVRGADGFPDYGAVLHVGARGGNDAGGDFQIYSGHGSANGGNYLRVRNADNNANPSDSWTSWRTIWDSGNFNPDSKAAASHTHAISDVTGLQTALDGKLGSLATAASATSVVTLQDTAPTGAAGKLWWETDTGKLKVYYGSAWVDASPIPDTSLYYSKAGGTITGDVTVRQTLTVIGNVLIEGTLTETSDITLKENIVPLQGSLNKLMKLNGVSFNKIDTPEVKEVGFIAQEVEQVLPELVTETEKGIKTVAYSRVTAVLVETVKEQQAQINELKELVNKLTEKLNSL